MKTRHIAFALFLSFLPASVLAQGADKNTLLKPPADSWPTHHGDYSARRYSSLKAINDTNVENLSLDWMSRITGGMPADQQPGRGGAGNVRVGGSPLLVHEVLYFTANDNAWGMDAHSGRILWHYYRESTGLEPVTANKGMGMYGNWLYFITRDNFLVSL